MKSHFGFEPSARTVGSRLDKSEFFFMTSRKDSTLSDAHTANLFDACVNDDMEVFLEWLKFDPRCFEKSHRDGITPTHTAARCGSLGILRMILSLDRDSSSFRDAKGFTPFSRAAEAGQFEAVKLLLEYRPECIQDRDDRGKTPLHRACRGGHIQVIQFLLNWETKSSTRIERVRWEDFEGETPLFQAVAGSHPEIVRLLLHVGAEVNHRCKGLHATPLHTAIRFHSSTEVIRILLQHGAEVDGLDDDDHSPLHLAIERRAWDVMEILLREGHANYDLGGRMIENTEIVDQLLHLASTIAPSLSGSDSSPLNKALIENDEDQIEAFEKGIGTDIVQERRCELSQRLDPQLLVGRTLYVNEGGQFERGYCVEATRPYFFGFIGPLHHIIRMHETGEERTLRLSRRGKMGGIPFFVTKDENHTKPLSLMEI